MARNNRQYVALVPALDRMMGELGQAPQIVGLVESFRQHYRVGPDEQRPPGSVLSQINAEWLANLGDDFPMHDAAALYGRPFIEVVLQSFILPNMAACLTHLTVFGDMPRMNVVTAMEGNLELLINQQHPRAGKPKDEHLRAFIRDGIARGLTSASIAFAWCERHPEEYPDDEEATALRKMVYRIKQVRRAL